MDTRERIELFLSEGPWAVVGASPDRSKYGNKVLRAYLQAGHEPAWPVHPTAPEVEGLRAYPDLEHLPQAPRAISIITPPPVTEEVVRAALALGVERIWMQPGAESEEAVQEAEEAGALVLAGGPCLLVAVGYRE